MTKDMMRRLAAVEAERAELPIELREWLGEPLTEAERAAIAPAPPQTPDEDAAAIRALPSDMRAWFEDRAVHRHHLA